MPDVDALAAALAPSGLVLRGGIRFEAGDDAPPGPSGRPSVAAMLVGNAGAAHWPGFRAWLDRQPDALTDPLDRWTAEMVEPVAARFGAHGVYPFEKPYHPFQAWARRAEGLRPSPLGILMHPRYGLWHAYRAALLFDVEIADQVAAAPIHLCDLCVGRPCLKPCPVGAHSETGFDYASCLTHVGLDQGIRCREDGCLDRNACPYGVEYRYPATMQAFHMAAFRRGSAVAAR
ncbi:MAG: hypothetical protein AB7I79_09395 [Rhizobiaceae bacterium]